MNAHDDTNDTMGDGDDAATAATAAANDAKARAAAFAASYERAEGLWRLVDRVCAAHTRTLLYGPPGTGKTTAGHRAADMLDVAAYALPMTEDTPAAELRGHYIPRDGNFVWQDGPAIRAWREGAVLILDEIDLASGDALTFLHALLDDPKVAAITLPTGEIVRPTPSFRVVGTMNGIPSDLPAALRDRFAACIEIPMPHPGALLTLPVAIRPLALDTATNPDPSAAISIRSWHAFVAMRGALGIDDAAFAIFGARGPEVVNAVKLAEVEG